MVPLNPEPTHTWSHVAVDGGDPDVVPLAIGSVWRHSSTSPDGRVIRSAISICV